MRKANRDGQPGSSHHYVQAPPAPEAEEEHHENEDGAFEAAPPAEQEERHVCDTCGAVYPTEKAMFGHLRSHKERLWRGAYCPPSFSMDEFAEYRELLVKSEEEQLREIQQGEGSSAVRRLRFRGVVPRPPSPPPRPRLEMVAPPAAVLELDLNAPPEGGEWNEEAEGRYNRFDLNLPPSDEE
ncbi:unnamed protein product [Cuscuta campestris]|uniref:C2H2-type domain-containing protein n=1 Tax=Cuscuta campestris TaxID=132261 RepID=A0A484MGR1_9ASTE|nr:unnamed protein product [Cuscuta campestris]